MHVLMLAFSVLNLAQAEGAAAAPSVQIESIWDFVVKGGRMMIPIGLCSLIALAVIVERLIMLSRRRVIPPTFLPGVKAALNDSTAGRKAALSYCRSDGSPVANVLAAGIRRLGEPTDLLEKHVAEAGEREVFKLRKYLRVLSVIAAIAPLLGLLGTILGMITAFQTVAGSAEALGRAELLAKGIYEAMITTAAGLFVAIPVLVGYHWISARIERLVREIDEIAVEFVEEFARGHGRTVDAKTASASVLTPDSHPAQRVNERAAARPDADRAAEEGRISSGAAVPAN